MKVKDGRKKAFTGFRYPWYTVASDCRVAFIIATLMSSERTGQSGSRTLADIISASVQEETSGYKRDATCDASRLYLCIVY